MAPILRSRRSSPRLLVAAATTSTKAYVPIDFRTRRNFRGRLRCPPHLKTSKRGKRGRFLINIMLFDHFVAIGSQRSRRTTNR